VVLRQKTPEQEDSRLLEFATGRQGSLHLWGIYYPFQCQKEDVLTRKDGQTVCRRCLFLRYFLRQIRTHHEHSIPSIESLLEWNGFVVSYLRRYHLASVEDILFAVASSEQSSSLTQRLISHGYYWYFWSIADLLQVHAIKESLLKAGIALFEYLCEWVRLLALGRF
jgi:hypothetical protein